MVWQNFGSGIVVTDRKMPKQTIFRHIIHQGKQTLIFIGKIQTTILMGIVYYLIIGPMALIYRLFRVEKQTGKTYWIQKEHATDWDTCLRRQF